MEVGRNGKGKTDGFGKGWKSGKISLSGKCDVSVGYVLMWMTYCEGLS